MVNDSEPQVRVRANRFVLLFYCSPDQVVGYGPLPPPGRFLAKYLFLLGLSISNT